MIKFLDLPSQYQKIKNEIDQVVLDVMERGVFVGGEYVENFERDVAQAIGCQYALGVGNGTDAIELALRAMNFQEGQEVILPSNTFFGSLEGIVNARLKPIFIDCDEDYCIDVDQIVQAITPNTVAIMPVHLYGRVCNMDKILQIAQDYRLKVVEDCAQSFGAKMKVDGKLKASGSFGDVGCFSFYPGKNLGAYGDGGLISTSDEELYVRASSLANHGRGQNRYEHLHIGRNSRLDAIQAGILSVKLKYIEQWNQRRRECAKLYCELLEDLSEALVLPKFNNDERNVWHLFVVRLRGKWKDQRDSLLANLKKNNIECSIHYPYPLNPLPRSEEWSRSIFSLPMGEHLSDEDIVEISRVLRKLISK